MMAQSRAKQQLGELVAETWDALVAREPQATLAAGKKVTRLNRGDLAEAEANAAEARMQRHRLERIDLSDLDRTERLTVAYMRALFDSQIDAPERWWTGFGIAPYSGSVTPKIAPHIFGPIDLTDAAEAERYLKLAGELADAVDAMHECVLAQAERGWRLPKPALPGARHAIEGAAAAVASAVQLADDRAASDGIRKAVRSIVEERIKPAYARLLEAIGVDYEAAAPAALGLVHQPGGADAYRVWLRYHLGYEADPAEIHQTGLDDVASLAAEMARVRIEQFGHHGDEASFHARLAEDPKAKASTPAALEATYNRHLDRMTPVFARLFRNPPRANPVVRPLPPALADMTFGYYAPPRDIGGDGTYYYSSNGIPDRLQMNAAPLIFHELVPGHHVQVTRQQENAALPDIRRNLHISTTFSEGWAEYASGLGDEAGLFDDPYDYYGFLSHQRFIAQRLVVDTGLNALGWTLDEAHAYMSANTLEKPEQVTSEILRYATDMPAQALCYRMGFLKFRELRAKAMDRLGPKFDLADFHEAILDQGCLPIPVLEASLDEWIEGRPGKC
jgi:uncharacterized protein (DUF885 family)